MKTIVTHSGGFHADDVFAVAAFQLLFGEENVEVIRTRDEAVIAEGDYVVDVGGVYNHQAGRYDHHQLGAPVRENGIPYAGFGLMWKHYGEEICGSKEIAEAIEERLCQPIDAGDNGISLYTLNELGVKPFEIYNIVSSYVPVDSAHSLDVAFKQAVDFARGLISRMIVQIQAGEKVRAEIQKVYEAAADKTILVFDIPVHRNAFIEYEDVQAIVYPSESDPGVWRASVIPKAIGSFASRVLFPQAWAGLQNQDLAQVSGIEDAHFCHKGRFLFAAGSKESALKAAQLAE